MILNKQEFNGVYALSQMFYEHGMASARIGVSVGITAFFVSVPSSIRITCTGVPDENYTLMEDFQLAYAHVA